MSQMFKTEEILFKIAIEKKDVQTFCNLVLDHPKIHSTKIFEWICLYGDFVEGLAIVEDSIIPNKGLQLSCEYNRPLLVERFILVGDAKWNVNNNKALILCAKHNSLDAAKKLQELGATFHFNHEECLQAACYYSSLEMIRWLLEDPKTNIDAKGGKALEYTVINKNYEAFKILLSKKPSSVVSAYKTAVKKDYKVYIDKLAEYKPYLKMK